MMLSGTASSFSSPASLRRRSLGRLMDSSTMLLLVVIGTLIVLLAFLILFHHNLNATKGYRLRSLEVARTQLLLQQEVLNMEIAGAQALEEIRTDPRVQAMVRLQRPIYAQTADNVAVSVADVGGISIE